MPDCTDRGIRSGMAFLRAIARFAAPGESIAKEVTRRSGARLGSSRTATTTVALAEHLAKAIKPSFQILDDLLGELVRFRQVIQIDQALVLEPEDIEAGAVSSS